jgi:RNA-directed DNA polymerase
MPHYRIRPSQPIGPTQRIPHSGLNARRCRRRLASYSATNVDQPHKNPMPTRNCRKGQYETSVPVLMDRCHQARIRNALEPEWEAKFEARSYGFRPGRGCADAIGSLYSVLKGRRAQRLWILDADLSAAFDRIDHARLLDALGGFPARELVERWLQARVIEKGRFAPTEQGSPQGGVISPLLMNVALHGLEEAAGVRYRQTGVNAGTTVPGTPILVRYADMVVGCCSQRQAQQVKARLAQWLAPRGLVFNEDKTRIVHLEEGFDFLGFNLRRYRRGGRPGKLLIKPSQDAVRRIRRRLADEIRSMRGSNAMALIARLNPIVRGWAACYRGVVFSKLFARWITTCGVSPFGGRAAPTPTTSRRSGSCVATSAGSTGSGMTGGCLAPAITCLTIVGTLPT